jgi:hypothetical protein
LFKSPDVSEDRHWRPDLMGIDELIVIEGRSSPASPGTKLDDNRLSRRRRLCESDPVCNLLLLLLVGNAFTHSFNNVNVS